MRVKVTSVLFWAFLLVARCNARPQELGSVQVIREDVAKEVTHDDLATTTATTSVRSRLISPNAEHDSKGYKPMDQSLKSVTTQLLNVSDSESSSKSNDRLESRLGLLIQKPQIISDDEKTIEIKTVGTSMNFGRFSNSKFSYFENSHPGQAMALTEEELEKELTADRHPVTDKTKPSTPGGISTWILLNPPSTTSKSTEAKDKEDASKVTWKPAISSQTTVKIDTTLKADLTGQKNPQSSTPKSIGNTQPSSTTIKTEKTMTRVDSRTTPGTTERIEALAVRSDDSSDEATTVKSTTKKIISSSWTSKPTTAPNATTVVSKTTTIKVVRPSRPSKPAIIRKPSSKLETLKPVLNSTSKIEKVTFRPVQMIATPKAPVQPPMFVAKIQASVQTDTSRNITASSTLKNTNIQPNTSGHSLKLKPHKLNVKTPQKTSDHVTTIQIDPIKVNAPILTIEKIDDTKTVDGPDPDKSIELDESKIDMKFDFDPELTKIIETSTETSTSTGTTKKPKNKRKKNKIRRRKPSSTTPVISSSTLSTPWTNSASEETTTEAETLDISLQESKIVSDAQVSTNSTKTKKKQGQKPIGTQIYNFISREVMSNFGMMSLVGLGLGIASYFFYPFGTPVARRNGYEDPKVKYNMDFEYGANGGQNEEEIMSQVLQGMTMGDKKYGGMKDYENNYYRYQAYDGAYTDTTRRSDVRYPTSAVPVYRAEKTRLPYDSKYRHTDFKYPDAPTTPNYYDRQVKPEFLNNPGVDRQFVVGNVPKEYAYDDQRLSGLSSTTENIQTDFEKQIAQSMAFVKDPIVPQSFSTVGEESLKVNEGYEDIEITPTAVAIEHGPRALQFDKIIGDKSSKSRKKRDSNIQLIPTRRELEKAEAEDDLSNEILDIIDSAIPTKLPDMMSDVFKYAKTPGNVEEKISGEENKKKTRETVSAVKEVLGTVVEVTKKNEEAENSTVDPTTVSSDTSTIGVSSSTVSPDDSTTTSDDGLKVIAITSGPTSATPTRQTFNFFDFVKKLAEVKFRVGLTLLKHASESFTKYLGNVQKRLNDGN